MPDVLAATQQLINEQPKPAVDSTPTAKPKGKPFIALEQIAGDAKRRVTFPPLIGPSADDAARQHRQKKQALQREPE